MLQFKSEDCGRGPTFGGISMCFLLRPSSDGMRSTHMNEGNLFYPKCTHLNVTLI